MHNLKHYIPFNLKLLAVLSTTLSPTTPVHIICLPIVFLTFYDLKMQQQIPRKNNFNDPRILVVVEKPVCLWWQMIGSQFES